MIGSILLGIPGSPSSIATCFDGYPMTRKGEAVKALGAAITAVLTAAEDREKRVAGRTPAGNATSTDRSCR